MLERLDPNEAQAAVSGIITKLGRAFLVVPAIVSDVVLGARLRRVVMSVITGQPINLEGNQDLVEAKGTEKIGAALQPLVIKGLTPAAVVEGLEQAFDLPVPVKEVGDIVTEVLLPEVRALQAAVTDLKALVAAGGSGGGFGRVLIMTPEEIKALFEGLEK